MSMSDELYTNGQLVTDGEWQNRRWCSTHQSYHGVYYRCRGYPLEILEDIKHNENIFIKNIRDTPVPAEVEIALSLFGYDVNN